jgi:hypothetical protein
MLASLLILGEMCTLPAEMVNSSPGNSVVKERSSTRMATSTQASSDKAPDVVTEA